MYELFSYTVSVFDITNESKAFLAWFKKSKYTEEFSVEIGEDEGKEVLEIIQHNPSLTFDGLFEVYLIDSKKRENNSENDGRQVIN